MKTLLDTLNLKQVNLVGWSDGGNTGLILASKYPDYVKKLVTMGANLNPDETAVSAKNDIANKTKLLLLEMVLNEPHLLSTDLQKKYCKNFNSSW